MTFLLVGEAPNPATVGRPHLWLLPDDSRIHHTANRLRDIAGWTTEDYLRVFSRRDNILDTPPAKWGKAQHDAAYRKSGRIAKLAEFDMGRRATPDDLKIVCLGKKARQSFHRKAEWAKDVRPFEWELVTRCFSTGKQFLISYLPHTSGLNRWWNDPFNLCTGQAFLRSLRDEAYYPT